MRVGRGGGRAKNEVREGEEEIRERRERRRRETERNKRVLAAKCKRKKKVS